MLVQSCNLATRAIAIDNAKGNFKHIYQVLSERLNLFSHIEVEAK